MLLAACKVQSQSSTWHMLSMKGRWKDKPWRNTCTSPSLLDSGRSAMVHSPPQAISRLPSPLLPKSLFLCSQTDARTLLPLLSVCLSLSHKHTCTHVRTQACVKGNQYRMSSACLTILHLLSPLVQTNTGQLSKRTPKHLTQQRQKKEITGKLLCTNFSATLLRMQSTLGKAHSGT